MLPSLVEWFPFVVHVLLFWFSCILLFALFDAPPGTPYERNNPGTSAAVFATACTVIALCVRVLS